MLLQNATSHMQNNAGGIASSSPTILKKKSLRNDAPTMANRHKDSNHSDYS